MGDMWRPLYPSASSPQYILGDCTDAPLAATLHVSKYPVVFRKPILLPF